MAPSAGRASGPPIDLDVLADLHAGVYAADVAAVLRARAEADPRAREVLAALDATTTDLHELRNRPPTPIPRQYASRLDATIAAEAATRGARTAQRPVDTSPGPPRAQVVSLDQARARRVRSRTRWAAGLGIAAAVAAVFTLGAVILRPGATPGAGEAGQLPVATANSTATSTAGSPGMGVQPLPSQAQTGDSGAGTPGPTSDMRNVVARPNHLDELLPEMETGRNAGPFNDQGRLVACMSANGAAASEVLSVLPVTYQGTQGYAVFLSVGPGKVRILVVGPSCGKSGGDLMDQETTTR